MKDITLKQHTHINNVIGKGQFEHPVQLNFTVPKNILMFQKQNDRYTKSLMMWTCYICFKLNSN